MQSEYLLYLKTLENRGLSLGSIKGIKHTLSKLTAIGKPLTDISYTDLVNWQSEAFAGLGATTSHHRTKHVKAFFSWCVDAGLLEKNPARSIIVPKRGKRLPHSLTDEQLRAILDWSPEYPKHDAFLVHRDRVIVRLFMYTGIRRAEACSLNLGDLSLAQRSLVVHRGKWDKDRVVPLPVPLIPELQKFLKVRSAYGMSEDPSDPLLVGKHRERLAPDAIGYMFNRKLQPQFPARVTPHMLRHSYATYLMRRGVGLRHVQELLGHESLATTQVYLHVALTDLHEAVTALDAL